jgi:hypothetical protein
VRREVWRHITGGKGEGNNILHCAPGGWSNSHTPAVYWDPTVHLQPALLQSGAAGPASPGVRTQLRVADRLQAGRQAEMGGQAGRPEGTGQVSNPHSTASPTTLTYSFLHSVRHDTGCQHEAVRHMLLHGLLRRMQQQQTQAGFNGQSPSPPWWAGCLWCGSGLYNYNNQPTMHQSS